MDRSSKTKKYVKNRSPDQDIEHKPINTSYSIRQVPEGSGRGNHSVSETLVPIQIEQHQFGLFGENRQGRESWPRDNSPALRHESPPYQYAPSRLPLGANSQTTPVSSVYQHTKNVFCDTNRVFPASRPDSQMVLGSLPSVEIPQNIKSRRPVDAVGTSTQLGSKSVPPAFHGESSEDWTIFPTRSHTQTSIPEGPAFLHDQQQEMGDDKIAQSYTEDDWPTSGIARDQMTYTPTSGALIGTPDVNLAWRNPQLSQSMYSTPQETPSPVPHLEKRKGVRGKFEPAERERVRGVRKKGACLLCHLYKERCDEEPTCENCTRKLRNPKTSRVTRCIRTDLPRDVKLYRTACPLLGQPQSNPAQFDWHSKQEEVCIVDPRIPKGPHVMVACQTFVPRGSQLKNLDFEYHTAEGMRTIHMPKYAIHNLIDAEERIKDFLEQKFETLRHALYEQSDFLLRCMMVEANRLGTYQAASLPLAALKLRVLASTMFSLSPASKDVPAVFDAGSMYNGQRPLPPFVNLQVTLIMEKILCGHAQQILKDLKHLMERNSRVGGWYEAFVTIYLLLSSLEYFHDSQVEYVWNHQSTSNYMNISSSSLSMCERWQESSRMLVEHFEILVWARRDSSPFGINSAGLDQTSAQLLENIRGWLEPQRDHLYQQQDKALITPEAWLWRIFFPR